VLIGREKDTSTLGMKFVLSLFHITFVSAKEMQNYYFYLFASYIYVVIKLIYIYIMHIYIYIYASSLFIYIHTVVDNLV
jgi:hypothetical protein